MGTFDIRHNILILHSSVQLISTAILSSLSFFSNGYRNWIQSNQWMMWVSLFGAIGFMVCLPLYSRKKLRLLMIRSAFDILEAQELSHKLTLPGGLHWSGSVLYIRHSILLRIAHSSASSPTYSRNLRGSDVIRLPNQV